MIALVVLLFEISLAALGLLLIVTQIFVPLLRKQPLFPWFRNK